MALMGTAHAVGAASQRTRALARANDVRLARAELKRRIAAGEISAADVVESLPWEASTMSVGKLLLSQHRWGETRTRRLLHSQQLPEAKLIGTFTDRQATALAAALAPQDSARQGARL